MHGHTTEIVTNLLLPGIYDLRSVAKSKSGEPPLNAIDIIDGDDYDRYECVDRLRSAKQHPELQQLVLSEIYMDDNVIDALVDLLRSTGRNNQWDALYLEFCEGDLDKAIESILKLDSIRKIELAGNVDRECIRTLASGLAGNTTTSLEELTLLTTLDEESAETLVLGLKANSSVRRLKLIKCVLTAESIRPFTDFFRYDASQLEAIYLDRCHVADKDIAALVDSLKDLPTLKELYIGGNLCEEGLRSALSNLIIQNTLKELSLQSRKQIWRESHFETSWMVPALEVNTSLRILDLSENSLCDKGLENLLDAFCNNTTLEEVRLHENHISNHGAQLFGKRLVDMKGLKRVFLHRNRFDEIGAHEILQGVRSNVGIVELTIPTMGRNKNMSTYQRLISYETCLNSGGKLLLRDTQFPMKLFPLVLERAGSQLWTPYCEYQMQSLDKWKRIQQMDLIYHLIRNSGNFEW